MKFRIEFARPGVRYKPEYRRTIDGALQLASSKGWFDINSPDANWSTAPSAATISIQLGPGLVGAWEKVATVSKSGIEVLMPSERPSVQEAKRFIAQWNSKIEDAMKLATTLLLRKSDYERASS